MTCGLSHGERQEKLTREHGKSRHVDTAAALRLLGLRDQVHPLDGYAYAYRDQAAADAWQESTFEHHGIPSLGTSVGGDEVIGVYDLRACPGIKPADPSMPDDWQPSRKREAL
jgi:hypothetical protein